MSAIDTTIPVFGDPTTQSVRDNFATAASEIDANAAAAATAQTAAGAAQTSANNAQSTANAAQTAAGSARTAADNAQTSADAAQSSASAAQSTANAAQTAAGNAQTSANNAQSSADAAQSSAATAQTSANAAQATANAAVKRAGDTMTGKLALAVDPTAPLDPVTLQYFNAHIGGAIPEPVDANVYGRSGPSGSGAWTRVLALAGGVMTGALTLAADPVSGMQPVTLQYFNAHLSGGGLADAPNDGTGYVRLSGAWSNAPTFGTTKIGSGTQNALTITPGASAGATTTLALSGSGNLALTGWLLNVSGGTASYLYATGTNNSFLKVASGAGNNQVLEVQNAAGGNIAWLQDQTTASASPANYLLLQNATTGNPSVIATSGADTNRSIRLTPAGTGTVQVPTMAAGDNSTAAASTAFVLGQASNVTPNMDGVAAIGTSLLWARADHRHASDTSRLSITGGTLQGNLNVAPPAGAATLTVTAPTGQPASLYLSKPGSGVGAILVGQLGSNNRWAVYLGDNTPESSGNVGSAFVVQRFSDAGAYLDNPLTIARDTAAVTLTGNLTAPAYFVAGSNAYHLNQDASYCYQTFSPNWYWGWNKSNGALSWIANGFGAFSIDASGNGSFGGTMNAGGWQFAGNPAFGCYFDGNKFITNHGNTSSYDYLIRSWEASNTWFGINAMFVNAPQTAIFAYYNDMALNVYASATPSDRRLKRNIKPAGDALSIVRNLAVHDLDFIAPSGDVDPEHWAFSLIADEVAEMLPYAVINPPPAPSDRSKGYSGLHGNHLLAALWRAVQQLAAEVAQLKEAHA